MTDGELWKKLEATSYQLGHVQELTSALHILLVTIEQYRERPLSLDEMKALYGIANALERASQPIH